MEHPEKPYSRYCHLQADDGIGNTAFTFPWDFWKVGGEQTNTCGMETHHTPYGTGTLLTLLAMTAWAPCSSSRDGQQACGRHSYGFRMDCPCCDSLGEKSPYSFFFSFMRRYGMYDIYTPSKVRKCRISRNSILLYSVLFILIYSLCIRYRREHAFYPAKVLHLCRSASVFIRKTSEIFLSSTRFESVFPIFSARTFRMPHGTGDLLRAA